LYLTLVDEHWIELISAGNYYFGAILSDRGRNEHNYSLRSEKYATSQASEYERDLSGECAASSSAKIGKSQTSTARNQSAAAGDD
jgi:hypothetical protein